MFLLDWDTSSRIERAAKENLMYRWCTLIDGMKTYLQPSTVYKYNKGNTAFISCNETNLRISNPLEQMVRNEYLRLIFYFAFELTYFA